jgi:hypothetical protein
MLGLVEWKYLVVDEGHRLKNKDSKLVRELKGLPAGTLSLPFKEYLQWQVPFCFLRQRRTRTSPRRRKRNRRSSGFQNGGDLRDEQAATPAKAEAEKAKFDEERGLVEKAKFDEERGLVV